MTHTLETLLPPAAVASIAKREAMLAALRAEAEREGPDSLPAWCLDQIEGLHRELLRAWTGR